MSAGVAVGGGARDRACITEIWRATQRKLKALDVAAKLEDLSMPAGNRLEKLRGDQADRHSMRINEQYRITFRWEAGHAYEVRVEDHH